MTIVAKRKFIPDNDAIYLGDNGRALCGQHLGVMAANTGRDISGQKIARVTAIDAAWWKKHSQANALPKCETCQKEWTR